MRLSKELPWFMENNVYLCYVSPELQFELNFPYQSGLTVAQLLTHAALNQQYPNITFDQMPVGIWGKIISLDTLLKPGDRVELYRPLLIDPKAARRLRADKRRK